MNNKFLLFYSPKTRSQVRISIYRNWPMVLADELLTKVRKPLREKGVQLLAKIAPNVIRQRNKRNKAMAIEIQILTKLISSTLKTEFRIPQEWILGPMLLISVFHIYKKTCQLILISVRRYTCQLSPSRPPEKYGRTNLDV